MSALKDKITKLRPQALNLIEAYDVPDQNINSSIGNSYGDIYEQYINSARQSKLNKSGITQNMMDTIGLMVLTKDPLAKL